MSQIQNLIISDDVLNQQVCNYCHKYLSVTPVKVYPNRRIKCGRCSTNNNVEVDTSVDSMYNQIATISFFKCINKFDGCTQLLESSEVIDHEKICISKKYICPICSEDIFAFLMIRHFKLNHPESFLDMPNFQVNDLKNINKHFLYQLECDLFFVNFSDITDSIVNGLRKFSLNIEQLDKKVCIKNFKADFFVQNTDILSKTISSSKMTCNISLNVTSESKLLAMFYLNVIESNNAVVNLIQRKINIEENNLKIVPQNNSDFNDIFHKQITNVTQDYLKTLLFQKRDIFPNEKFKDSISNCTVTENLTLSFTQNLEKCTITFGCCVCSLLNTAKFKSDPKYAYLIGYNDHYYMICFPCSLYFKDKWIYRDVKKIFTIEKLKNILFFCIWGCGKPHNYEKLYIHERNCKNQILQRCPIESCFCYFKLYEFQDHFENKHSFIIFQSLDLIDRLLIVNLDTSKSPIKHVMLFWCICILVQFNWDQPNWKISLACAIPDVELKAKIFDINKNEICTVIDSGSVPYQETIQVVLYLLDTKKAN